MLKTEPDLKLGDNLVLDIAGVSAVAHEAGVPLMVLVPGALAIVFGWPLAIWLGIQAGMPFNIAVGATGLVGQEMLRILEARAFPVGELRAYASPRSEGRKLPFRGGTVRSHWDGAPVIAEEIAIESGDTVVITAGTAVNIPGSTNVIKVDVL